MHIYDPSLVLCEGRTSRVDGIRTQVWSMWYKKLYHCTRGSLKSNKHSSSCDAHYIGTWCLHYLRDSLLDRLIGGV